ncbi:MAG: exodeoxyribonuclease VII small subunit [Lachnospiraceae bacterium]|nr:exodeoxyribonuclease VII small subunit [Lachnospiraceae bacterium]
MAEQKESSLEELFEEIESILGRLENKDISLEDSFILYEQGMKKLKACNDKINQVEKKMLMLNEQGNLVDFE